MLEIWNSISQWNLLRISSITVNNNTSDGNLNVLITHADGSTRTIVFSKTGMKYYEREVGGTNTLYWQYSTSS